MCQAASGNQVVLVAFVRLCSCSPALCVASGSSGAVSDHRLLGRYSLRRSLSCLPALRRLWGLHSFTPAHRGGLYINSPRGFGVLPLGGSWANGMLTPRAWRGRGAQPWRPGVPGSPGQGWHQGQGGLWPSTPFAGALLLVTPAQHTIPNWKLEARPLLVFRGNFQRL